MKDYLTFKKMITPMIIQIIFWIGVAAAVVSGLYIMFALSFVQGLVVLLVGPIMARIWCELVILAFRINENLVDIKNKP